MTKTIQLDRRSVMKGGLVAATSLAAPFVLRKTARASDQAVTVLNTFPTLANEYWQGWDAGARQACTQLGLKYLSQTFEDSVEKQIAQIEQAPSLGVNAVVTFAQNAEIIKALARTAKDAGVLLANAHSTAAWLDPADPAFQDTYVLYSQPDNVRGVAAMADVLFKRIGGEGKVIYVAGLPGNFSADTRAAGVKLALSQNPKIELVAEQNGGENRVAARPVVENLLTAHPDVKAIVSYNSDTAIAVLDVLRERGLSGQIFTNGVDETSEMLGRIQTDKSALGTVGINGAFMTGYSVVTLYDALQGVKTDPLENMRFFDSMLIDTPESAASFSKMMDPKGNLPFDFKAMSRHVNPDAWSLQWGMEIIDPRTLWSSVPSMASSKPADWKLPEAVMASLTAGNIDKLNAMYRAHFKAVPLGQAVALTSTKKTVLNF